MAKQANRMMIGGFVVISIFILAASLVVFGSGKFFTKTTKYVLYFDRSVKGLSVGAPVLFQGVQIGSVAEISILTDPQQVSVQIPVIIDIEPSKFEMGYDGSKVKLHHDEHMPVLIEKGLRAVLTMQSLITGSLMVEIDFYPGTPVHFRDINKKYIEIPTIPSTTERFADGLAKVDIEALQKHVKSTLSGIDRLVNNPDLAAAIKSLKAALAESEQVMTKVNTRIDPLADNLDGTLSDTRKLVNNVDQQVDPLAENMNNTVKDFGKLARSADVRVRTVTASLNKTMVAAKGVLSEDAPLIVELESTLTEISAMARSFRQLANYLERHPEALIQGKGNTGKK